MIVVQAALDRAVASMALGGGGDVGPAGAGGSAADWQQQLQQVAAGGDWAGELTSIEGKGSNRAASSVPRAFSSAHPRGEKSAHPFLSALSFSLPLSLFFSSR